MDMIYLYCKNGDISIIKPGDKFDKFTYEQLNLMTDADRNKLSIKKLDDLKQGVLRNTDIESVLRMIDLICETKIEESFQFREEYYPCKPHDIAFINLCLAVAKTKDPNPYWAVPDVPFYIITRDGHRRVFDPATIAEFAKQSMFHILSHRLSAQYLKIRVSDGEAIENIADSMHWPAYDEQTTPQQSYISIVKLLNSRTSVDTIDDDYAEQLLEIQRMLE